MTSMGAEERREMVTRSSEFLSLSQVGDLGLFEKSPRTFVSRSKMTLTTLNEYSNVMSYDISMDMILEILTRLPVKSLMRFKLVCKTWYDLVENPDFIEEHRKRFTCKTFLVTDLGRKVLWFINFGDTFVNYNPIYNNVELPQPQMSKTYLSGICNGLVCVHIIRNDDRELRICNPEMRMFWRISPYKMPIPSGYGEWELLGFGIHDKSYKLVRIVPVILDYAKRILRCELYTMSTNTWKEIQLGESGKQFSHRFFFFTECTGTCANGVVYWKTHISGKDIDEAIALFDFKKEVFDVIKPPSSAKSSTWHLCEIKGELALVIYPAGRLFEIWVLNEIDESWTKRIEIENIPVFGVHETSYSLEVPTVLGCTIDDVLILIDVYGPEDAKILTYDLSSGDTKVVHGFHHTVEFDTVYLYSESLISVNKYGEPLKLITTNFRKRKNVSTF